MKERRRPDQTIRWGCFSRPQRIKYECRRDVRDRSKNSYLPSECLSVRHPTHKRRQSGS